MNPANHTANFGTLFTTLAALTSPGQEFVTSRPTYRDLPGLRLRDEIGARLNGLIAAFWQRQEQARVKRALERLDDHLLRDIGLSRAQVNAGLLPPFARPEERPALGKAAAGRW